MRRGVTGVLARTSRDQKPMPEPALGFRLPRHTAPGRIPARGALRPSLGTNFLAPHIAAKAPLGANGGEVRGQDGSQPEGEEGGAPQPGTREKCNLSCTAPGLQHSPPETPTDPTPKKRDSLDPRDPTLIYSPH